MPYIKDHSNPSLAELQRRRSLRKLTRIQILDARRLFIESHTPIKQLALIYHVSHNTIWRYVKMPYSQIPTE